MRLIKRIMKMIIQPWYNEKEAEARAQKVGQVVDQNERAVKEGRTLLMSYRISGRLIAEDGQRKIRW